MQIQAASKGIPLKPPVVSPYRSIEETIMAVFANLSSLKIAHIVLPYSSRSTDDLRKLLSPLSASLKKLGEETQTVKSTDKGLQNLRKALSERFGAMLKGPVFSIFFDTKAQPEVIISNAASKVDELIKATLNVSDRYVINELAKIISSLGDDASSFLANNRIR